MGAFEVPESTMQHGSSMMISSMLLGIMILADIDCKSFDPSSGTSSHTSSMGNLQGYTLITNNGICNYKDGGFPTFCDKSGVSSTASCANSCTSDTSCVGFVYGFQRCFLFPSQRNCPIGFTMISSDPMNPGQNLPLATSMNDLVATAGPGVCYGKQLVKEDDQGEDGDGNDGGDGGDVSCNYEAYCAIVDCSKAAARTLCPQQCPEKECKDLARQRFCDKRKAKGKCSKEKVWKKCEKTCGRCEDGNGNDGDGNGNDGNGNDGNGNDGNGNDGNDGNGNDGNGNENDGDGNQI